MLFHCFHIPSLETHEFNGTPPEESKCKTREGTVLRTLKVIASSSALCHIPLNATTKTTWLSHVFPYLTFHSDGILLWLPGQLLSTRVHYPFFCRVKKSQYVVFFQCMTVKWNPLSPHNGIPWISHAIRVLTFSSTHPMFPKT